MNKLEDRVNKIANKMYESGNKEEACVLYDAASELRGGELLSLRMQVIELQTELRAVRDQNKLDLIELGLSWKTGPDGPITDLEKKRLNASLRELQIKMHEYKSRLAKKEMAATYYVKIQEALKDDDMLQSAWATFIMTLKMRLDDVPGLTSEDKSNQHFSWYEY